MLLIYESIKEPVDSNFHMMALASLIHMDLLYHLSPSELKELISKVREPGVSPVLDPKILNGCLADYVVPPKKVEVRNYPLIIISVLLVLYFGTHFLIG